MFPSISSFALKSETLDCLKWIRGESVASDRTHYHSPVLIKRVFIGNGDPLTTQSPPMPFLSSCQIRGAG